MVPWNKIQTVLSFLLQERRWMQISPVSCSAVRNTSRPRLHVASPPVTVTWNMVHESRECWLLDALDVKESESSSIRSCVCFLLRDDLPDLQEVREESEPTATPVYQVEVSVSHQGRDANAGPQLPDTRRLTQLAHIATGPQSPLLQASPRRR